MALSAYRYRDQERKNNTFGSVTLTGRIARSGEVVSIRKTAGNAELAREAIANLQSWRLEPAAHEDDIQMTYDYVSDPDVKPGVVKTQLDLPNRVTFRTSPINPPGR